MANHQVAYGSQIGQVKFSLLETIAGSRVNCQLSYTVGKSGIDDSGSIKILWRLVSDAGTPQFDNPSADNFVSFTSNNPDLHVIPISNTTSFPAKLGIRPWCKGIQLILKNTHLSFGQNIGVHFHNWQIQSFCEKKFGIRVLVDPFATNRFIKIPGNLFLSILPDKPKKLVVIAPTQVKKNDRFSFLIKLEDQWGNPCSNVNGEAVEIITQPQLKSLPRRVILQKGRALVGAKLVSESAKIIARWNKMLAISNPIVCQSTVTSHFWADLHGQTVETVGSGSIDDYLNFAKKYSLLDVTAHQGNDFQISSSFWKKINKLSAQNTRSGKFVVLPGFEWSGNSSLGGDRNVLYLKEDEPIFRSSHILVDDLTDLNNDAPNVKHLFHKLKNRAALVIAHVGGRYAELIDHDPKLERLVEVHSVWGTFEWILFEALTKGWEVGIVANSDGHDGRVGSSYPGHGEFDSYGGLTCILAKQLTREHIFQALVDRHCYGTTGARIFIDEKVIVNHHHQFLMGDQIELDRLDQATLHLKILGTSSLDLVEIFDKTKIIHRHCPKIEVGESFGLKILFSGSLVKGRNRKTKWLGSITFEANQLIKIAKTINFFNPEHHVVVDKNTINFNGATTGGVQGFVIDGTKLNGKIAIRVNNQTISQQLSTIGQAPSVFNMGGLDNQVQLTKVPPSSTNLQPTEIDFDLPRTKNQSAIFVKVTQNDGHMAWTSPVFIKRKKD